MMRLTFKAVLMVSLLMAVVLSFNLLVGAQDKQQTGTTKTQTTGQKKDNTVQQDQTAATQDTSAALGSTDRKFVMDAAHMGMMEVEIGRLATQKGASDEVKQFGQRMVDDHSRANEELMKLASIKGITLPSPNDFAMMNVANQEESKKSQTGMDKTHHDMMKKHQKVMTKLNGLSGAEFDREYMDMMVEHHTKAVSNFEKEAKSGTDADLKQWASEKLPTVREHLQQARTIEATLKK